MKNYFFHGFYIILFAVFIFGFQYLPLQDYPALNYQGFLMNQYFFHGNNFNGFWHLHNYIPPNAMSTVIIGLMDIIMDPFTAGKIYIFALAVAMYSGIVRYLQFHLHVKRLSFLSVSFYLTMSLHFLMAYLNFLTGIALLFHLIVYIRKGRHEAQFNSMVIAFLLLYLCHFAAFSLFVLYFFIYFIWEKRYSGLWRMALASIPSLIIFIHYIINRTIAIVPDTGNYYSRFIDLIHWKILIFFSPLIPFNVFKWVRETPAIFEYGDYVFVAVVFLLIAYIFTRYISHSNIIFELLLALSTFCLAIILPFNFGGVSPAGERVVIFCIVNVFIVFYKDTIKPRYRQIAFVACFSLGLATYSYDLWNTALFSSMAQNNIIPQDAVSKPNIKLEGTNGFLHLHFYNDIREKKPYPYFNIGLFGYPDSLEIQ